MPLKLMYITNSEDVAHIAEEAGVDRIFVDMEYIGKTDRQGGMDTVQSRHTADDVRRLAQCLNKAELFVRVNPIHEKTDEYNSSKEEIDEAIEAGADLLMLPYFKTAEEVQTFVKYVNGRAKTVLLVETPEAAAIAEDLVQIPGIDEMFIGLNDLSLGYGKNFMFELLLDGTVEELCLKFRKGGIPYGFGGIASLGKGMLPSEYVIKEHYRLGSACAILSRSFCRTGQVTDLKEIQKIFEIELPKIRELEEECRVHSEYFWKNRHPAENLPLRRSRDSLKYPLLSYDTPMHPALFSQKIPHRSQYSHLLKEDVPQSWNSY